MATMEIDTRRFDAAIARLSALSSREIPEQIRLNAGDALQSVVFNSPRRSGNMNAGWWPAWRALNRRGTPNTRLPGTGKIVLKGGREYIADGAVEDHADEHPGYVVLVNRSHAMIPVKGGKVRRVNYPYIVDQRKHFIDRGLAEAEAKINRRIEQQLDKRAKRAGF
jgi:hypothetical protein